MPFGFPEKTAAIMETMDAFVNVSCKAVLFDMDGTLVDSTTVVELAWRRWAARHHLALQTVLSFSHGRPTIATMEHFFPGRDHTGELKEMEHIVTYRQDEKRQTLIQLQPRVQERS